MTGISKYLARELGDHVCGMGTRNYTPPSTLYVAGFTVAPTDAGGGTEGNYGGYARVPTTSANWSLASGTGVVDNSTVIQWPLATSDEGAPWVAFGIYDQASGGNLLIWSLLQDQTLEPETGDQPEFGIGQLDLDFNSNIPGLTNLLAQELADHVMGTGSRNYTPTSLWMAGFTVSPTEAGGGTEGDYGSYARDALVASNFSVADTDGFITNTIQLAWPKPTTHEGDDWVTIGLMDAATLGNVLLYSDFTYAKEPRIGDIPIVDTGKLDLFWNAN
jgi:hypothetical protein